MAKVKKEATLLFDGQVTIYSDGTSSWSGSRNSPIDGAVSMVKKDGNIEFSVSPKRGNGNSGTVESTRTVWRMIGRSFKLFGDKD